MNDASLIDSPETRDKFDEWQLNFVASRIDGEAVSEKTISTFLDKVIKLAENNGFQLGGGIRPLDNDK